MLKRIGLREVEEAQKLLLGKIVRTPVRRLELFADSANPIYLKMENEQLTGSFKIRGALNKLSQLQPDERKRGVIASSAGNHAQGVAYGAKQLGISAHIVMPETTPMVKINATKAFGAEVILAGEVYDDAFEKAKTLEKEKGYTFIHPYQDERIISGQGTIGLEILEDLPDVDTIVVPIGGGGLISGIATAVKSKNKSARIIGVVSSQAPGVFYLKKNQAAPEAQQKISTIAEGIAVKKPSKEMFDRYISELVDDVVIVDDDEIARAIAFLLERKKTLTEGSGAAGFAAVLANKIKLGAKTCVVLCGGNIDLNVLAKVIERGLRLQHRLARFTVVVGDLPGSLNRLTTILAGKRANVLEVYHDRVSPELAIRETRIDLLVETASLDHIESIRQAFVAEGFRLLRS